VRLFVAITPPEKALEELEAVVAPLRAARPDLRWTSSKSWHVTLAFLGEVDDAVLDRLTARIERVAAKRHGLVVSAGGAGAFPTAPRGRVLWTRLQVDREALRAIARSVAAAAGKAGAPPADEQRRFRPHITLARSREPADLRPLIAELSGFAGTTWTADRVRLIRSHLGPDTWYESIGDWPLQPPAHPPAEPAGLSEGPGSVGCGA
jgi:RNA 2',3'-cyclic 3'-phosphodiesterase